MDAYETLWRGRAAEHGITDVDWYIYDRSGALERHTELAEAERLTVEYHGMGSCGRGAHCADIAPFLGGTDRNGYFSGVEALLDDEYDDD
jgi:hypothetical protein